MISLALLADAMIGNVQEKAMKKFAAPNCEVVLYSYSLGLIYLGIALVISGQLLPSIRLSNLVRKIIVRAINLKKYSFNLNCSVN